MRENTSRPAVFLSLVSSCLLYWELIPLLSRPHLKDLGYKPSLWLAATATPFPAWELEHSDGPVYGSLSYTCSLLYSLLFIPYSPNKACLTGTVNMYICRICGDYQTFAKVTVDKDKMVFNQQHPQQKSHKSSKGHFPLTQQHAERLLQTLQWSRDTRKHRCEIQRCEIKTQTLQPWLPLEADEKQGVRWPRATTTTTGNFTLNNNSTKLSECLA